VRSNDKSARFLSIFSLEFIVIFFPIKEIKHNEAKTLRVGRFFISPLRIERRRKRRRRRTSAAAAARWARTRRRRKERDDIYYE